MNREQMEQLTEKMTEKEKEALKEALAVIYLDDSSDFRNGLWEVIRILVDNDDLYHSDTFEVQKLLKFLNPEIH